MLRQLEEKKHTFAFKCCKQLKQFFKKYIQTKRAATASPSANVLCVKARLPVRGELFPLDALLMSPMATLGD